MPAFKYSAIDKKGKTVKGVVEGDSERQVRAQLRSQHLKPLTVVSHSITAANDVFGFSGQKWRKSLTGSHAKLRGKELSLFTRQLASLVQSGLPLSEALQATAKLNRNSRVQAIVLQVRTKVQEGHSLAQALAEQPKSFDSLYRAMVQAGESAGFLGPVLEQLADHTERSQYAQQKMRMAMIYPAVLFVISVLVIGLLMAFVVPKLIGLFAHSGRELPGLTVALIAVSDTVVNYGAYILLGLLLAGIGFRKWLQKPSRRMAWHRLVLRMPFFGNLWTQSDSARFASTLGILLTSGVPLLQALRIAAQVLSNDVIREASNGVVNSVQQGGSLHRALNQAGVFPPLLIQMAASGETNGTLEKQLTQCATNQERDLEMLLGTLLGLFEPLMVVFMGFVVTLIVLAVLLPIFELNKMV